VHTFCNEALEHRNYIKFLERTKKVQIKNSIIAAIGGGMLFFTLQLLYAMAFWFGGYLRVERVAEDGELYTGGQVIAIMFTVIFGAFNLGSAIPHIKALTEGRIACKLSYDTIDTKAKVDPNKKGTKVDKVSMNGKIVFQDVCFSYPTRPESQVLKKFSCEFEAGKTTALVGYSGSGKSTII